MNNASSLLGFTDTFHHYCSLWHEFCHVCIHVWSLHVTHERPRDRYCLPADDDSINRAVCGLSGGGGGGVGLEELLFEFIDLYLQVCLWSCWGSKSQTVQKQNPKSTEIKTDSAAGQFRLWMSVNDQSFFVVGLFVVCFFFFVFPEMSFVPVFDHYRGAVPLMRCCSAAFLGDARSPLSHTKQRTAETQPRASVVADWEAFGAEGSRSTACCL